MHSALAVPDLCLGAWRGIAKSFSHLFWSEGLPPGFWGELRVRGKDSEWTGAREHLLSLQPSKLCPFGVHSLSGWSLGSWREEGEAFTVLRATQWVRYKSTRVFSASVLYSPQRCQRCLLQPQQSLLPASDAFWGQIRCLQRAICRSGVQTRAVSPLAFLLQDPSWSCPVLLANTSQLARK